MVILQLTCATCKEIQRLDRDDFVERISAIPNPPDAYNRIVTFRCDECSIPNDETSVDQTSFSWN
jgi:hypothetical protein